ncbi:hypothetical protein [Jatrophihabitans fulvus]
MQTVTALGAENVTALGVGVILVIVVIGVLLGVLIAKLIVRLIITLVVVVLAIVVWQQRGHVEDEVKSRACNADTTFFGVHLDPPDDVKQACARRR